jgi:DNA-binding IclR family transcriptional regulator
MTTEMDLLTGERGFDAIAMLSVLTEGYYGVDVLAEEAGLSETKAAQALGLLVNYGLARRHPLEGYASKKAS